MHVHRLVGVIVPPKGGGPEGGNRWQRRRARGQQRRARGPDERSDDVEAHRLLDRPIEHCTGSGRDDEGDDVEAHSMSENPSRMIGRN